MGRAVGGVVVGFVLWTVAWVGFGAAMQAAMPDLVVPGRPLAHAGVLLAFIAWSAVISVAAGYACAAVRGTAPMRAVWALALVLLAVGVAVEVGSWGMAPAWYHLAFLALLVPATVWGGGLRAGRAAPAGAGA
jgi:hypothetical protein